MATVARVTAADFGNAVLASPTPVVVDVYAPWCGPCRVLAPVLDRLAAQFDGTVRFAKVDVDEEPAVARYYGITGVPTLLFFRDGRLVDRASGLADLRALTAKIEALRGKAVAGGAV